jgi:hypothetical protein
MNGAFLHLAVNHVPVVGLPLLFLLLTAAALRRSRELAGAGFVGLALMAVAAFAALKTGGPAHHVLDALPGSPHEVIREHARAARWAWYGALVLGLLGLAGLRVLRRAAFPAALTASAAFGALFVSIVMGRVAHLGGLIRHPETALGYQAPASAASDHDHDEDHDHDHDGGEHHD